MKELKITIPENQEIDWQESAKQKKIVFKPKAFKPKSWEEYCNNTKHSGYYIGRDSEIAYTENNDFYLNDDFDKNLLPTKKLAQSFLALMQLMSLRQAWIGDWKPDHYMNMASNWGIEYEPNPGMFSIENHCRTNGGGLTFPTKEMAEEFLKCFKDLIEEAKILL